MSEVKPESKSASEVARGYRTGCPEDLEIVRRRVRALLAFRGYGIPSSDRPDVEQEVLAQLWKAVRKPGFDESAGFWGLVDVITTRRSIDYVRSQRPSTTLDRNLPSTGQGPLGAVISQERAELVRRAISRLGRPCRELLELRVELGKPYRELAEVLHKTEGALRMQMVRCIERLRQLISELETRSQKGPMQVSR